jgi:hypothetical protein
MNTIEAFLVVYAVGGLICGVTWFFARKIIQRSWLWRGVFCILVGATIAPTIFYFWSSWVVWPAALMLLLVFDGGKNGLLALLYGALPMLVVATVAFSIWSFIIRRRHRNESHMA